MNMRALLPTSSPGDALATLCKAGGDPLRLNVLRALTYDSFGVLELAQIFATGQSGMSHHLKVLAQAGLVATRREGNAIFYRRSLPQSALHSALLEEVDSLVLDPATQARIEEVHGQRAEISRAFFTRMAATFQVQQDLIAGLPQYQDSLLALLDSLGLPATASALEIGPGDGSFLPELARRFATVSALDNSEAMLELARQRCEQAQLTNVTLHLGDALHNAHAPVDCVVLNMVLHHLATPAEAFQQLARLLRDGGHLLISELCRHDQTWAREACGDLWLGFEQDDLSRWAQTAGLSTGESLYIGLKNGFQIQLRHFVNTAPAATTLRQPRNR